MEIIDILNSNTYHWFKSLGINRQILIAAQYTDETSDNTNLVNGLTKEGQDWLVTNFSDDIKDYIILNK